jgi:hypothetical protein
MSIFCLALTETSIPPLFMMDRDNVNMPVQKRCIAERKQRCE